MMGDEPVAQIHHFDEIDLVAFRRFARIFPRELPAVREEQARPVPAPEFVSRIAQARREERADRRLAVQHAGTVVGQRGDDEWRFEYRVVRVQRHQRVEVACDDGGVPVFVDASRIGVGVRNADGVVEIAVTDQGEGIPEEDLDRVFERFFRVDQARSRNTGGTGLGLSIVKHAVQNHGGDVRVWSQPGRGSTFTIRLPEASTVRPPIGDNP